MQQALDNRASAGVWERDTYASYLLELFLTEVERHNKGGVVQIALGAEPLPFESGSKLRGDTLFDLAAVVSRHKDINFQVFLANAPKNQALCTLVRERLICTPSASGGIIYPTLMTQVLRNDGYDSHQCKIGFS